MSLKTKFPALAAGALLLAACSADREQWTLTGTVPAGTAMVVLDEPTTAGGWYAADSVAPDPSGKFTINRHRARGTIFRLHVGERELFVPADSTETITLTLGDDGRARLDGSPEARLFTAVDSVLAVTPDSLVVNALLRALDGNFASQAAYYATRRVTNWRLLRTVANRHMEELPDNPRTAVLAAHFDIMRAENGNANPNVQQVVIEAPVTSYFEIELMDRNGKMRKLSSVADSASVAVLAFVDFTASDAPAVNLALGEAASAGAAIYQVGFAENQHLWALASEALPWTNVYQSESASRTHLQQYMVSQLPMFFLFRNGEIVERVTDPAKLKDSLK